MVFSEDWFSAPLVTTTCQEDGEFERPDWEDLSCVIRRFQKSQSMSLNINLKQQPRNVMTALQPVSKHFLIRKDLSF